MALLRHIPGAVPGVVCSGIAFWLWFAAVRDIGSSATGTYLYLEPFVTMFGAAWLLHERITPATIVGGITVLIAVAVVASTRNTTPDRAK